jgi:hypothetical protein
LDAVEEIEAESKAVLTTLTEHRFQAAFKNGRSAGNGAYTQEGNMVASRPKLVLG